MFGISFSSESEVIRQKPLPEIIQASMLDDAKIMEEVERLKSKQENKQIAQKKQQQALENKRKKEEKLLQSARKKRLQEEKKAKERKKTAPVKKPKALNTSGEKTNIQKVQRAIDLGLLSGKELEQAQNFVTQ